MMKMMTKMLAVIKRMNAFNQSDYHSPIKRSSAQRQVTALQIDLQLMFDQTLFGTNQKGAFTNELKSF